MNRYIAPPEGGSLVLHRLYIESGGLHEFGHWNALCGRVVPGWTTDHLDEAAGERECQACARRHRRGDRVTS